MNLPAARNENLVVQNLKDEVLIYDLLTHQAFNLNKTSSIVYQACGDGLTFGELKNKHKFTDDLIHLALDELKANDLLIEYKSEHFKGLSRREAIRRVGLASMVALPLISSLVAPRAVDAQSGICPVGSCIAPGQNLCPSGCNGKRVTYLGYPSTDGTCTGGSDNVYAFVCSSPRTVGGDLKIIAAS